MKLVVAILPGVFLADEEREVGEILWLSDEDYDAIKALGDPVRFKDATIPEQPGEDEAPKRRGRPKKVAE
jgi:hypothetical protein